MQIVIDIPEEEYAAICYNVLNEREHSYGYVAIANGIVLPKGHGRLVDADMVMFENCVQHDNLSIYDEADCDMDCKTCDWLELYPKDIFANVIIPADKEVDDAE